MSADRGTSTAATLVSWKEIGRAIGRSERWCRYMAAGPDPLPVVRISGRIHLERAALDAWLYRQREQTIARDR